MRDFVSCFSENAINISHPSCSSYSNAAAAVVVSPPSPSPSVQTAVTTLYATTTTTLSAAHNQLLMISVTWTKTHSSQSLAINFAQSPATAAAAIAFKLDTTARFFKKNKGSKSYDFNSSKIEILWDLSAATYDGGGAEPISGFYVLITVDSEIGLILGEISNSWRGSLNMKSGKWWLISRTEHWCGNTLFSTKAKFRENGESHEILIRCSGEEEEGAAAAGKRQAAGLWVWIDKKAVIRVKRLQWNFRGNQSIFVDGLLVDLLWDVHDWFYGSAINGFAVFMFRTRSGLESRLWLEEEKNMMMIPHNQIQKTFDFSLLIYASKTS